jgi:sugar porter (SP) family MFS transporter
MIRIKKSFVYFFGALGGMLFGYDTGIISGAILFIKNDMHLSSFEQGIVVSAILLGAIIGAALISFLSDRFGRKKMVLISAFIFALGALFSAFAINAFILTVARIILGTAVGGASALVPLYLAEMSPTKQRGALSTLNQLMITIGILSAYIVNLALANINGGWRIMLGFAAFPATILFLGTLYLPESPRWLLSKNKNNKAIEILNALRTNKEGQTDITEVEKEISEIKEANAKESGGFKDLMQKWVRPSLVIGIGLAVFQQLIGINTVIYYAPTIFTNIGLGDSAAILSTVGIGILNVLVTILALFIMDKFDRKKLLIIGSIGMTVSLILLYLLPKFQLTTQIIFGYFTLIFLCIYIFFFALTWGPIMWIMIGEVFPLKVRGFGVGISSVANWMANLAVALIFPFFFEKFGKGLFGFFALMSVLSIFFIKYKVFETRGHSLEEIEMTLYKKSI